MVVVQLVNVFPHELMNRDAQGQWTDSLTREDVVARLRALLLTTSGTIWDRLKKTHAVHGKWPHRKSASMLFVAQTLAVMQGASYVVGTCHHITFGAHQDRATDFASRFQRALEMLSEQT
jgi:hypothetical protein